MSRSRLCALGCPPSDATLHRFPNPGKDPDRFKAWCRIAGEKLGTMSDHDIHTKKRICDIHFIEKDRNRNNRLNVMAVPSLHLPVAVEIFAVPSTSQATQPSMPNTNNTVAVEIFAVPSTSQATQPSMPNTNNTVVAVDALITKEKTHAHVPKTSEVTQRTTSRPNNRGVQRQTRLLVLNKIKPLQKQISCLKREICRLRKRGKTFKSRLLNAEKLNNTAAFQRVIQPMTNPAKLFTAMQFRLTSKKPKGRRFTLKEKVLSLSMYKKSPRSYALLAKYFTLPAAKSLKKLLAEIKIQPGINKPIFEKIKQTIDEKNVEDRLCTLIFDEMSLTPQIQYDAARDTFKGFASHGANKIADHALVFMVKGIKANFKQPVAYYFTSNMNKTDLKNVIKEVIKKVNDTGLRVLCTVCDQSTVNVGAVNELIDETKKKFLRTGKAWRNDIFDVNGKHVIPVYDVPHLLKGLRNNLLTKNMTYVDYEDGDKVKIVKWEYFQSVYAADKSFGELRYLHKITEEHVNPDKIKKMRVKTAAQVFSHSVAVATEHMVGRNLLPEECRHLIPMVLLLDRLFDSLNASTFHIPNGKIYKGCVKRFSPHHELWQKAKKVLKTVEFELVKKKDKRVVKTTPPSVTNLIKTIEGIQLLWTILSQKYNFDAMLTRHINQDPVENFFGNIRSYGVRNNAPNCVAFEGAFKSLLLNNFNSPHSIQANCEKDENECLQTLDFFLTENVPIPSVPNEEIPFHKEIYETHVSENVDHDSGQRNYVCGWVLSKCLKLVKSCKNCKRTLSDTTNPKNDFIHAKEYTKQKKWLCYPSAELEKCFHDVQNIVTTFLKKDVPQQNVKRTIKMFTDVFVDFPFNCEIHKEQLRNCFEDTCMNIIIYSWCRSVNRILAGKITFSGDDEIKNAAQLYYNKHKHYTK